MAYPMLQPCGPLVAAVKRAIYQGATEPYHRGLRHESAGFLAAISTPAAQRAMRAYLSDVEDLGEAPLYPTEEFVGPWRDGVRIDLTE